MEDWKERLKAEYAQLKDRLEKLHRFNVKQEATHRMQPCRFEKVEDDQNFHLCREQEEVMTRYLYTLELRAEIYGIEL